VKKIKKVSKTKAVAPKKETVTAEATQEK